MFELVVVAVVGLVTGATVALKVIAPKTKSKVDDKLVAFLDKYGAPVVEYLEALEKKK